VSDVGTMFILDSEKRPHASAGDFGKGNEESGHGAML
jgi:hypothetical protein